MGERRIGRCTLCGHDDRYVKRIETPSGAFGWVCAEGCPERGGSDG